MECKKKKKGLPYISSKFTNFGKYLESRRNASLLTCFIINQVCQSATLVEIHKRVFLMITILFFTGISVFRQGDIGCYWYAVLSGTLDVNVSATGKYEVCRSRRRFTLNSLDCLFVVNTLASHADLFQGGCVSPVFPNYCFLSPKC